MIKFIQIISKLKNYLFVALILVTTLSNKPANAQSNSTCLLTENTQLNIFESNSLIADFWDDILSPVTNWYTCIWCGSNPRIMSVRAVGKVQARVMCGGIPTTILNGKVSDQSSINQACQPYESDVLDEVTPTNNTCFTVSSRQGWQYFNLPGTFRQITSIEGSWSVDDRNYSRVTAQGHIGESANRLAPYNQYKYDQNYPFGRLLVDIPNYGYISVNSPLNLPSSINSTAMRINDADNALGDNGGSLRVCFGF